MADRKVARRFTLKGKTYKKGSKVSLPADQAAHFEKGGLVEPLASEEPKKSDK